MTPFQRGLLQHLASWLMCGWLGALPLHAQAPSDAPPSSAPPAAKVVPAEETEAAEPALPALSIGHPAPPLMIEQWYAGQPIEKMQSGQVYVVEFWATWCGPCLTSMPHLSQLQAEYGEKVQMIGVTREEADVVNEFLEKEQSAGKLWKDIIKYRLAMDKDGMMSQAFMRAAQQSGIPTAFIVGRDGAIEWIGHPMTMDEPLAKIVSGDWDRAEALAVFERQQHLKALSRQLNTFARAKEWDNALGVLDEMQELTGTEQLGNINQMRLAVLNRADRKEEAAALLAQLVDAAWENAQDLNSMAWNLAVSRGDRDLTTALKISHRAVELTAEKDASILDTLARVHYEMGDLEQAISWQTKAVDLKSGNPNIDASLRRYQKILAAKNAEAEAKAKAKKEAAE